MRVSNSGSQVLNAHITNVSLTLHCANDTGDIKIRCTLYLVIFSINIEVGLPKWIKVILECPDVHQLICISGLCIRPFKSFMQCIANKVYMVASFSEQWIVWLIKFEHIKPLKRGVTLSETLNPHF